MKKRYAILTMASLLWLNVTLADDDHLEARRLVESGRILPLETLLESIPGPHGGRILELELEHESGRYIYEIELLDSNGEVWEMELDAQTGEILTREQED